MIYYIIEIQILHLNSQIVYFVRYCVLYIKNLLHRTKYIVHTKLYHYFIRFELTLITNDRERLKRETLFAELINL